MSKAWIMERKPAMKDVNRYDGSIILSKLSFLRSMACWFEKWQRDYGSSCGLTNPTFKAVIRTANGIPLMAEYLFEMQSYLSYLLLRNIQSD